MKIGFLFSSASLYFAFGGSNTVASIELSTLADRYSAVESPSVEWFTIFIGNKTPLTFL